MLLLTMGVGLQTVREDAGWSTCYRSTSSQAGATLSEGLTGPYWDIEHTGRIYYDLSDLSDITPRWE